MIKKALTALAAGCVMASVVVAATPVAASSPRRHRSPAITVPRSALKHSVWCDRAVMRGSRREAVLLVPGTGGAPNGYWNWNYELALPPAGFGVCTVSVPGRETGSAYVAAQYVAYAARYTYRHSHHKIAIIGHSQGGSLAAWVVKFWPDIAAHTRDVVSMSGDMGGTEVGNILCATSYCPAVAWQARVGSQFLHALRTAPTPASVPITSIYSSTDEVVFPEPAASSLPGAANIGIQQLCPGRVVDHVSMVSDAVGYALVLDALRHRGPARARRVARQKALCSRIFLPHTNLLMAGPAVNTFGAFSSALLISRPKLAAEPALPRYAARYGSGHD